MKKWKIYSTFALISAGMIYFGWESYSIFFDEIRTRVSGNGVINWESLAALCGWSGKPNLGESEWAYRIRTTWDMVSSRMAVTAFSIVISLLFYGIVRFIFWATETKK